MELIRVLNEVTQACHGVPHDRLAAYFTGACGARGWAVEARVETRWYGAHEIEVISARKVEP
jgi:hypothetical protein